MAKYIILVGIMLIIVGLILNFYPGAFKWFGNLPGDFKKTDGSMKIYFPLTSMILISVFLSILLRFYRLFS